MAGWFIFRFTWFPLFISFFVKWPDSCFHPRHQTILWPGWAVVRLRRVQRQKETILIKLAMAFSENTENQLSKRLRWIHLTGRALVFRSAGILF
jgi:hypothetical protein